MFRFNIPVTKVDEERRLVYGLVTEEIVDQAGEILDYESSKAHFQEWSDGISKASGGNSLGNLRLMHQPTIAGKLVELNFDDALKQISCVARIVSDDVWKLVLEGCLTGFSMGGKYVKRWKDEARKGVHRFTARPVEVSVVDNPCVSTATFEYIKSDGSTELRKFHTAGDGHGEETMLTQEQIAARAAELAKAAGTPDATDQFLAEAETLLLGENELAKMAADADDEDDAEAEKTKDEDDADKPKNEDEDEDDEETEKAARAAAAEQLVQVWQAPDGTTHVRKADGISHIMTPPVAESAVEKALREARGGSVETDDLADVTKALGDAHTLLVAANEHIAPLAKGLWEVREFASVLTQLQCITSMVACEAKHEGDGSTVPAELLAAIRTLGATFVSMAEEEVAEMIAMLGKEAGETLPSLVGSVVELAAIGDIAKADSSVMQKVGARNSRNDAARIQATHDTSVALGAECQCDAGKAAEADDLAKSLMLERDTTKLELTKAIDGIADLGELVKGLRSELDILKKTPQALPPLTDHVVVERMGRSETIGQLDIEKMSPDDRADLAIRLAQMNPQRVGGH